MAGYFFIQSLDAFAEKKTTDQFQLMRELAGRQHTVNVLLVQNAVFMASAKVACPELDALVDAGINVRVDHFSLLQRGLDRDSLRPGLQAAALSCVIDAMLDHHKVIWN